VLDREEARARAATIQAIFLDVDGTLTDGGIYFFEDGRQALRFHVRDGMGLVAARRAGLVVGIVSGRDVPAARRRAEDLKLDEIHLGISDKKAAVEEILARRGLAWEQVCFIGDDVMDLPPMTAAGLGVAVADAHPEVQAGADWVARRGGGRGAVREIIDLILAARARR